MATESHIVLNIIGPATTAPIKPVTIRLFIPVLYFRRLPFCNRLSNVYCLRWGGVLMNARAYFFAGLASHSLKNSGGMRQREEPGALRRPALGVAT